MVSNMKLSNLLCGGGGTKIIFCPAGFCAIAVGGTLNPNQSTNQPNKILGKYLRLLTIHATK